MMNKVIVARHREILIARSEWRAVEKRPGFFASL
jgi:hypothetical protein